MSERRSLGHFQKLGAFNIHFQLQILLFPPLFPNTSIRLPKILLHRVTRCHEFSICTGHHTGNWAFVRMDNLSLGLNGQGLFYAEWRTGLDQIFDNMWVH